MKLYIQFLLYFEIIFCVTGKGLLVGLEFEEGPVPGRGEGGVRRRREGDGEAWQPMRHVRCQEEGLVGLYQDIFILYR